ncbi:MAG: helix-hairpin-helix domain-containing protein [Bryobacterales bacterium]|nr:helix-hairpin-helix domain-containing protein [Bryobacterales bacterium]MDE0262145.1 helix-hairpin-helix domain-containing protein [Bryobacterales bacterium]MDE0621825.1 helix-hairpin-helix domain-containing protein [Bryobacterales bacterium]
MKPLTGLPVDSLVRVSEEVGIPLKDLLELVQQVENGASAAFLARYRADLCAGIDERGIQRVLQKLADIRDLIDRRISMMASLRQRGVMSDELRKHLEQATNRRELNDLFMPYRERKPGPAEEAIAKGLDPLARLLWGQQDGADIEAEVAKHVAADNGLDSEGDVLEGAYAIAAQWLSDKPEILQALRKIYLRDSEIVLTARPEAAKAPRVQELDGFRAKLASIDWKKRLSIRRGLRSGLLDMDFVPPTSATATFLERRLIQDAESSYAPHLRRVVEVALGNGLADRIKHNVQTFLDERTDEQGVEAYRKALRAALLAPPASNLNILGIEITRSGDWHAALIDAQGRLAECAVVRSNGKSARQERDSAATTETPPAAPVADSAAPPEASTETSSETQPEAEVTADASAAEVLPEAKEAEKKAEDAGVGEAADDAAASQAAEPGSPEPAKPTEPAPKESRRKRTPEVELSEFLASHDVDLIVHGSGPKPHVIDEYLRSQIRKSGKMHIPSRSVRDSGARIYAQTPMAKKEYRRLPWTFATAASLARRVQDPLAELAKADFRSTGVGQNYLELNSDLLRDAFRLELECAAHDVGIDANQASAALLSLVPGFTDRLARRVVDDRKQRGPFESRDDLRRVDGLNDRIFAQAVGFLRVNGANLLDNTGAHPQYKELHERIAEAAGCDLPTLLDEPDRLDAIDPEEFAGPDRSALLVKSAISELRPERRRVRGTFKLPERAVALRTDEELQAGAQVAGVVSNTADFGAFVDIGADQDGFLHVSQIQRDLVVDSKPALQSGDPIEVFIRPQLPGNRRIGLSMYSPRSAPARDAADMRRRGPDRRSDGRRRQGPRNSGRYERGKPFRQVFGPENDRRGKRDRIDPSLSLDEKLSMLTDKYRTKV